MNWLDIVIVCLAVVGIVKGLFDGLIKQVVSLIALVAGIFLCGKAAVWLQGYITELDWIEPQWISIISYVLGFILIVGAVLLAGEIVHRLIGATPLSVINHLIGGAFGIIIMAIFISLFFNLLEYIDKGSALISVEAKLNSRFYMPVKEIVPTIFPYSLF